MRPLLAQTTLVEQVYERILADISDGRLKANVRLIQDDLARALGVSRQPIQQALLLLHSQGFLVEAPGRGLVVAPIDIQLVVDLYEIRSAIEGLAARLAAERRPDDLLERGNELIKQGWRAAKEGAVAKLISTDMEFHRFIYEMSGNKIIVETTQPYWYHLSRVMGEVLLQDETPRDIWGQHERILAAIVEGDGKRAEKLSCEHIEKAAKVFVCRLRHRGRHDKPVRELCENV